MLLKSFTNITEKKTTREIAIGDCTIINAYFNLLFFGEGGGGAVRDRHIDAGSTLYSIINESSDITASYLSCQRDVAVFYLIIMSFG